MKILVEGEHNFFLFQDIVYYFLLTISGKWYFPIKNKFKYDSCFHYISESWKAVLYSKIFIKPSTKLSDELKKGLTDWMVATNIAILTAQKETGRRNINDFELRDIDKYKPTFLIEFSDNYNKYIVHLNEKMEKMFNCAVSFYKSFLNIDYGMFLKTIKNYYVVDESELNLELSEVVKNFIEDSFTKDMLDSYKIMEDEQ